MTIDIVTRTEAATNDGCAVWPHVVPQWSEPDGKQRGVKLRALTLRQRYEARLAATDPSGKIDQHKLMIEEVRRGIVDPPGLTNDIIEHWNAEIVLGIYRTLQEIGGWNPVLVERELDRLVNDVRKSE